MATANVVTTEPSTKWAVPICGKFVDQAGLASTYGVDRSYLSRVLAGKRRPSIDFAVFLAQALGITLDVLVSELETRRGKLSTGISTEGLANPLK